MERGGRGRDREKQRERGGEEREKEKEQERERDIHPIIWYGATKRKRWNRPCDLEIWQITLESNSALLLSHFKLWASFRSHRWFQTRFQSRNAQFGSKLRIFVRCDLEIWLVTLKNNRYFFYATSSFVHQSVVIGEFKLETPNLGQNRQYFWPVWPWNLTNDLEKQ